MLGRLLFRVKISGESGWPELVPGKRYLATRLLRPRVGKFVVFYNPQNRAELFVKKVATITDRGYLVEGTVPWASSFTIAKHEALGTLL